MRRKLVSEARRCQLEYIIAISGLFLRFGTSISVDARCYTG